MQLPRLFCNLQSEREMATSLSDITRLLSMATSDSSALAEVFADYFANHDTDSDHEFSDDEDSPSPERKTSGMRR